MKPISRTIAETLAIAIREDILSGVHAPGDSLRQELLAETYDVSRIPVREALFQLEAQGLVNINPHKGVMVRPMSAEEADEIFHLRAQIEPDLVSRNVGFAGNATFSKALELFEEMNSALVSRGPTPEFGDLHWQFHRELYCCNDRVQSMQIVDRLYILSERYIRIHLRKKKRAKQSKQDHKALLDACLTGKSREAAKLVRAHIEATAADLRGAF